MRVRECGASVCQADDVSIAAQMITKYDALPDKSRAHRVTTYLCSLGDNNLGPDLRGFAASGQMSECLRMEVMAYQLCVLDDTMAERPHAIVPKVARDAVQSKPAWWSGTIRLGQNLQMWNTSREMVMRWMDRWRCIGQKNSLKLRRGIIANVQEKLLLARVFRTGPHALADDKELVAVLAGSQRAAPQVVSAAREIHIDVFRKSFRQGSAFTWPDPRTPIRLDSLSDGAIQTPGAPGLRRCVQVLDTCMFKKNTYRRMFGEHGSLLRFRR